MRAEITFRAIAKQRYHHGLRTEFARELRIREGKPIGRLTVAEQLEAGDL